MVRLPESAAERKWKGAGEVKKGRLALYSQCLALLHKESVSFCSFFRFIFLASSAAASPPLQSIQSILLPWQQGARQPARPDARGRSSMERGGRAGGPLHCCPFAFHRTPCSPAKTWWWSPTRSCLRWKALPASMGACVAAALQGTGLGERPQVAEGFWLLWGSLECP